MDLLISPRLYLPLTLLLYPQEYKYLFEGAGKNSDEKTLEDKFLEYEVKALIGLLIPLRTHFS